jgi:hypothetical protein
VEEEGHEFPPEIWKGQTDLLHPPAVGRALLFLNLSIFMIRVRFIPVFNLLLFFSL